MAKGCALSTGNLLWGGLPRNSEDRIADGLGRTSAVYVDVKHQLKQTDNFLTLAQGHLFMKKNMMLVT